MARDFVEVQGRVVNVEMRYTSGGDAVTSVVLKLGDHRVEVSAWSDLAERVNERLRVGDVVRVRGVLSGVACFERGNGERGHAIKIRAWEVGRVKEEIEEI